MSRVSFCFILLGLDIGLNFFGFVWMCLCLVWISYGLVEAEKKTVIGLVWLCSTEGGET